MLSRVLALIFDIFFALGTLLSFDINNLLRADILMLKDYDRGFKIIIAGSQGVGKSSLLLRYVDNVWSGNLMSTIGVDFKFKTV